MLPGRHKRLLGGLAGIPMTAELARADTRLEWMATHPLYPENLKGQLLDMKSNLIEPFEDLYFGGLIAVDDIMLGKTRPTQHEVIGSTLTEEELEALATLEEEVDKDGSN